MMATIKSTNNWKISYFCGMIVLVVVVGISIYSIYNFCKNKPAIHKELEFVNPIRPISVMVSGPKVTAFSSSSRQLSHEKIIKNDPKWKTVWNIILDECTYPNKSLFQYKDLEAHQKVFKECLEYPDMKKWTRFEDSSHMPNTNLVGRGPDAENGWRQNNGKFRKRTNANNITIAKELAKILKTRDVPRPSGHLYYPKNGYKEWHTNKYEPSGWRLYIVHTNPDSCATFRYVNPSKKNQIVNSKDRDGVARLFKVTDGISEPLLWHTIHSDGDRWSFGFHISDEAAQNFITSHNSTNLISPN